MMNRIIKKGAWLLLFGLIIVIAAQIFLPQRAAKALEELIITHGEFDQVNVELQSSPAVKLAVGRVDRLTIYVPEVVFGNVPVEDLLIEMEQVEVDLLKALQGKVVYTTQTPSLISFIITEEGLNGYLQANPPRGIRDVRIYIHDEGAGVIGYVEFLGQRIELELLGRIALKNGAIAFVPDDFRVAQLSVGETLLDRLLSGIDLQVRVSQLPYDTQLEHVSMQPERLVFYGTIGRMEF